MSVAIRNHARPVAGDRKGETLPAAPGVRVEAVDEHATWNRLVLGLPNPVLEQAWEWGEALRRSGAEPHRWAAFQHGQCVAALSALTWRLPGTQLCILYAPRGPLLGEDPDAAWQGLARIADEATATGAVFLRLSPGVPAERLDVHALLLRHGFVHLPEEWTIWNAPKIVMTLGLEGSEADMWRRVSGRRRREITAAEAAGTTVEPATSATDLTTFYRLLLGMGRQKRYPVRRAAYYELLRALYGAASHGLFILARRHGEIVGGLLATRLGTSAYLLYSAVDRRPPPRAGAHPGPLLYWHFIRWAALAGCRTIHWGGSGTSLPPREADPGYGVYQFKRSFGSTCFAYLGYYDFVLRPAVYGLFRLAERRLGPLVWWLRARLNR